MKRSRQFRPLAPSALEDRVVLSTFSDWFHHSHHTSAPKTSAQVQLAFTTPSPDNILQGNVGNFHGQSVAQTLQAGNPVLEEFTTNFSNKTTQHETRLIVPNKAADTVTTTKTVNLRNNAGVEKIVDVATTTGATVTHNITTTTPNFQTETTTETDVASGGKTFLKGTTTEPGGSLDTYTGTVTSGGNVTTTDITYTNPEGLSYRTHTIVTSHDEFSQSTEAMTAYSDGTSTTSDSNTFMLRLLPPSS